MAQSGYTPISLYYSSTASASPTAGNLVAGELAINTADGKLFYKDSAGVVQTIATKDATSGSFTNLSYTGTLTGGTGVVNLGSGQFYKDASGNVGIGTSSPSTYGKLAVISASGTQLFVGADSASNSVFRGFGIGITGTTAPYGSLQMSMTSGELKLESGNSGYGGFQTFYTAGLERMRIDSSGNLLVGTTSTGYLNADTFSLEKSNGYQVVNHSSSRTSGAGYILFGYNGGGIGSISQNGTTGVTYGTTSDYRLKENVVPMMGALDKVAQLKPVTYTWKTDGSDGQGFIAHELQEVVPDCVTGEKDAVDEEGNPVYQGIDTSFLVATLTAALQEQQVMIEELKAKVAALEAA